MKKIPSLFKRDYEGTRLVYDEVVPGCEWVLAGEGVPTVKYDGTACMVDRGKLYKRYDVKPTKGKRRRHVRGTPWDKSELKTPPEGWIPCEELPNLHTGHWPGWLPVSPDHPADQWHREAWGRWLLLGWALPPTQTTWELVGPKINGDPYKLSRHELWKHGERIPEIPRTFEVIKRHLTDACIEGIVWWHPDGRKAKIKRVDFGLPWPWWEEDRT